MQHLGKGALRVAKNYTKGYSDTQAKVRDATSNDPWGPSGTQMNEIAQLTYNQNDFVEIMEMLDKRLNDKGKNWRHVFKSLTVLDYCLHQGSENVVIYFKDNIYIIKTLKEFQYVDEDGKDQGANVRQKAKDITNLLQDEARLRQERHARASMRDRMIKGANGTDHDDENERRRGQQGGSQRGRNNRDDDEMRRAIEESKRSLAKEQETAEDRDLQQAIKLSEEEEQRRNKAVEDSNSTSLFDDQNQLAPPTNNNNPFPTNFNDPSYSQFNQLPLQYTAVQPQFTSFNPYQQQLEQEAAQQQYMQQLYLQQQALQQQQQNEEMMRLQLLQQQQQQQQNLFAQQSLVLQPTGFGSNNPFAAQTSSPPPLPTHNNLPPPSFNLQSTYANHDTNGLQSLAQSQSPPPASTTPQQQNRPIHVKPRADENEHLANLFANRDDGQDTFGNIGLLRYGQSNAGRMMQQQTGMNSHNPFGQQQQQQPPNEQPFFTI